MKKGILILTLLILALFSLSCIYAADVNDTLAVSEDNLQIDQTTDDVISIGEDTNLASSEENEVLSEGEQTFAQLNATINGNIDKDIYLNGNYKYSGGDDNFKNGIIINRDLNIYGNGHTIDGSGKARIFQINGGKVVFYNITFVNGATATYNMGGAINGNCKAINCTFKYNYAYWGGAMNGGSAVNCTFSSNSASSEGGAMKGGSAVNCTFTSNSAYWGGAMNGGFAVNCTFTSNYANEFGGAMQGGSAVNCTFTSNYANEFGGAMNGGSAVNCIFTGNSANECGGAMQGGSAVNCIFTNNNAHLGGAMYECSAVNCTFSGNRANSGGAIYDGYEVLCSGQSPDDFYTQELILHFDANNFNTLCGSGETLPIKLMNQIILPIDFIDYDVLIYNEAGYVKTYPCLSNDDLSFDLLPGVYTAVLIVTFPGLSQTPPKNITLTVTTDGTTFWDLNQTINGNTNDTITLDRNYAYNPASDSAFTAGIEITRSVTINGNGHTIDAKGQARIFYVGGDNVTINNVTFVNGKCDGNGGAIFWVGDNGAVSGSSFTGNNANDLGGAICWVGANGTVSGSSFTGNNAYYYGGAIYWTGVNGNVSNSIFITNTANMEGDAIYCNVYLIADYCWFGGNATNYLDLPIPQNVHCDYILFLNATANPDEVPAFSTSEIVFKLYLYNKTSTTGNISEYDNTLLLPINLTITSTNGDVDIHTVNLGESIRYTPTGLGDASVTATIENVAWTIELNNIKANPNLSAENQVITYGENATIALNYNTNATGKVNITLTGKKGTITYTNLDLNATIMLPKDIPADEYNVTVSYSGDENFMNATANATLTVNKIKTELTASAVTTTYNINKDLVITLKDANGNVLSGVSVTVDLNGAKTYTTDNNGQIKVSTKGLAPKAYTAKVIFNGNTNYAKSTKDVKVTVKKATPKLTAKKKTFKSSVKTKKYTVTLKDNTGKAIKKAKVTLKVKGKTYKATTNSKGKAVFKIKNLKKKGKYTAVIKFKGNKYYNKATKKAKIKVIVTFKTVSKGSKDKATVKEIQQALKNNGYYLTYDGHYLKIDGIYHGCTERSVKEFQHDKGLKVTGKVDEKTAKKLGLI